MSDEKKTYYIAVANGEISRSATNAPWNFKIEATDEDITQLRSYFDDNYKNDLGNFVRAHIPFLEYHHDKNNNAYDDIIQKVYSTIYELGDAEARAHIEEMGILERKPLE